MGMLDDLIERLHKDDPKPEEHKSEEPGAGGDAGDDAGGQSVDKHEEAPLGAFGSEYADSSRKVLGLDT